MFNQKAISSLMDLSNTYDIKLVIGAEIEFYLSKEIALSELYQKFTTRYPGCFLVKEVGEKQHEIKLEHSDDLIAIAQKIIDVREWVIQAAAEYSMIANFMPKPIINQPGNAMHIHISAYRNRQNIFAKYNKKESEYLLWAIAGLLETIPKNINKFIQHKEDISRLINKDYAPTTLSWGGNNRTVTLRVPTTDQHNRRIEHRLSSANANPFLVIGAIIEGIYHGITNKMQPPKKIYGNAFDEQYKLSKIRDFL